jgi:predicted transposase YbfD/YdcC
VEKIVDKGGDYVVSLKGNQGSLHNDVALLFEHAAKSNFRDVAHDYYEETGGGHGRVEIRRHTTITVSDAAWLDQESKWKKLTTVAMVERERHTDSKATKETCYYISSLGRDVKRLAAVVRGHWGVENKLHWVLDIAFHEDGCRVRKDHGAQNLAILRHIALNLLKRERTSKVGVKNKRLKAGWDQRYLRKVLDVKPN